MRIIGGRFRGRRIRYHGDPLVRPMKHRTREAIFNLISTASSGRRAYDLFAGTGALGLEALSRGAADATFIEQHVPTARVVQENIATLGVEDRTSLLVTSAFLWSKRDLPAESVDLGSDMPWLVFCCPPYAFYVDRQAEMCEMVQRLQQHVPPSSLLIVEADERFDFGQLSSADATGERFEWDVRPYLPAVVGIWKRGA